MLRTLSFLPLLIFIAFFFSACHDNDNLVMPHPILSVDAGSIDYGSMAYYTNISVSNSGSGGFNYTLSTDKAWISFYTTNGLSYTSHGYCSSNSPSVSSVYVDRTNYSPGTYYGNIFVTTEFSTVTIPVRMIVISGMQVQFNNTVFTTVTITIGSVTQTVDPNESVMFTFPTIPYSFSYSAYTSGSTTTGTVLGRTIYWSDTKITNGQNTFSFDLQTGDDVFYLKMQNGSTHNYAPIVVNADNSDITTDNVYIPNDKATYGIGYYLWNPTCKVEAFWYDNSGYYSYWTLTIPAKINNSQLCWSSTLLKSSNPWYDQKTQPSVSTYKPELGKLQPAGIPKTQKIFLGEKVNARLDKKPLTHKNKL